MHHVQINVPDVEEALRFYETLGLTRRDDRPDLGVDGAWLDAGDQQLHLVRRSPPPNVGQHFALEVDDLDAVIGSLRGAGIAVSDPSALAAGLARQASFQDPAGNRVEVRERPPQDRGARAGGERRP